MNYTKGVQGSRDFTEEPITVAVLDIKVLLLPSGVYRADAHFPVRESIEGKAAPYPNKALKNLLEHILDNPVLDGQL